ncbi:MAG: undecaprenyl-diphosphate phosphatase [Bacteroidales bacterium]|nr:undecaprenyl-diphosphate phosphatase [Bacteroidales bacterium]
MNWIEAIILGIIQGLTEFLPVSSSGHLEIGKVILGVNAEKSLIFTVVVHGATVLSTIVVFRKDLFVLFKGLFVFKWNEETIYAIKIIISMIPVLILGFTFAEEIEALFTGNMLLVGSMLLVTALLLTFSYFAKQREKSISYSDSFIIGIAQALAVLPGISRSGATISTGLLLKNKKDGIAKFSFLMVLVPIIGANLKDLVDGKLSGESGVSVLALTVGFLAAFISGLLACKWMIGIVKKGKLIYFAIYCSVIGSIAIAYHLFFI